MTNDDTKEQIAGDLAEVMGGLCMKWAGHEQELARGLAGILGMLVAIHSGDPRKALDFVAASVRNTDFATIRAAHFGASRVAEAPQKQILGPTGPINIGTHHARKPR